MFGRTKKVGNVHARIVQQKKQRQSINKMWLGDFVNKKLPYKQFPTSHVTNLLPSLSFTTPKITSSIAMPAVEFNLLKRQDKTPGTYTLRRAEKVMISNTCTVCQVCHVEICGKRRLWIGRMSRIHEDGTSYTSPSTVAAVPHR